MCCGGGLFFFLIPLSVISAIFAGSIKKRLMKSHVGLVAFGEWLVLYLSFYLTPYLFPWEFLKDYFPDILGAWSWVVLGFYLILATILNFLFAMKERQQPVGFPFRWGMAFLMTLPFPVILIILSVFTFSSFAALKY